MSSPDSKASSVAHVLSRQYRRTSDGVWGRAAGAPEFDYSDGAETENRIAEIIANTSDRRIGSESLMGQIADWVTLYHFSSARANLLRPIAACLNGSRVLEVGAGCGAITRYLGECGAQVIALEGSARRAGICAMRCDDLDNVDVVCDTFQQFEPETKFDIITLIGVLEYSPLFGDGAHAPFDLIARCRDLLADNGVLIIAIENQLGLKYLAGAPEDHVPAAFFGINDLYGPRTAVTFGRIDLQRLLGQAGFAHTEFFAPLPDYKHPSVVIHERAFADSRLDLASIVRSSPAVAQAFPYQRTFSEEMSWPVFIRNGLGLDVANSFLVVASAEARSRPRAHADDSIWIYSTERRRCFAKEKIISANPGDIRVRTRRIYGDSPPESEYQHRLTDDEPYLTGTLLSTGFYRIVNRPGWALDDVAAWARPWIAWLADLGGGEVRVDTLVPAAYLEAIPRNIVVTPSGELVPFDLEWQAPADVPLPYVVLRGILSVFRQTASVARPDRSLEPYVRRHGILHGDLNEIGSQMLDLVGLGPTASQLAEYRRREYSFQRHVFGTELVRATRPRASQRISVRTGGLDDAGLKELTLTSVRRMREKLGAIGVPAKSV